VVPLGAMHYVAVASSSYAQAHCPEGLTPHNFRDIAFVAFNRKDDGPAEFVARALGLRRVALNQRFVPSAEGQLRAALSLGRGSVAPPARSKALGVGRLGESGTCTCFAGRFVLALLEPGFASD